MNDLLSMLQNAVEAVIFGNGFLALGGLAAVVGATVAIRTSRGIRV